jgi:hypothetical protein
VVGLSDPEESQPVLPTTYIPVASEGGEKAPVTSGERRKVSKTSWTECHVKPLNILAKS